MLIPAGLFALALWLATGGVALGAGYLVVILVREWRAGKLW